MGDRRRPAEGFETPGQHRRGRFEYGNDARMRGWSGGEAEDPGDRDRRRPQPVPRGPLSSEELERRLEKVVLRRRRAALNFLVSGLSFFQTVRLVSSASPRSC